MKRFALSSSEAIVLELLQQYDKGAPLHCGITDKMLIQHTCLSQSRISQILKMLKSRGLIRQIGTVRKPRKFQVVQHVRIRD